MLAVHKLQQHMDAGEIQVYIVGGYVRDRLLGKPCSDHDFVVVGGDVKMMEACGFKQVGADFPVFLSELGDEFALARIERKTQPGYHGFEVDFSTDVTIEEDLQRRDLTINSMARLVLSFNEEGHAKLCDDIVDPYGGHDDLHRATIRHTSLAFQEDPVRVLRAARFATRYGYSIHEDTVALMNSMVANGECDHLTVERVWLELTKALRDNVSELSHHRRFFMILDDVGLGDIVFPGRIKSMFPTSTSKSTTLLGKLLLVGITPTILQSLKAPRNMITFAKKWEKNHANIMKLHVTVDELYDTMKAFDLFRENDNLTVLCDLLNVLCGELRGHSFYGKVHRLRGITASSLGDELIGVPPKLIGDHIEQARKKSLRIQYR